MSTTFTGGAGAPPITPGTGYPVSVSFARQDSYNRFFAIPLVGALARTVLLIPHFIALYVVGIVTSLVHLVAWIPVLTGGSYPGWAYTITSGTIRWSVRVFAYHFGLTDSYPPFGLGANGDGYAVQVEVQYPNNPSKFFAIPVVGYVARAVVLIPHLIAIYVLYIVAGLFQLITWVPVLFGGQYPEWGESVVGGFLRWAARVYGYLYGLSDQYPPFSLSD